MKFKDWFKYSEEMTSTASIEPLAKPLGAGSMVRRNWIWWDEENENKNNKNKKKKSYKISIPLGQATS